MKFARCYVSLWLLVQLAACDWPGSAEKAGPSAAPATREAPATAEAEVEGRKLVLAFGDSLYAGYGLEPSQGFPAALERELAVSGVDARVINAGVSGDTTAAGLRRLAFTLDGMERRPDLAIVGLGANDALRGISPEETRRNLDAILSELRRREIPVFLTGMMAPRNLGPDFTGPFDAIFPDLAKRHQAELDPFFLDGVITNPTLLLPDGMHPNAAGIERIAGRLGPQVAEALAEGEPVGAAGSTAPGNR